MATGKILLVEEDKKLSARVKAQLEKNAWQVIWAASAREAEHRMRREAMDLILLDTDLPDESGVEFCKRIRKITFVPVVFLGNTSDGDRIAEALNNGGDDYVARPVEPKVLLARIESNVRRCRAYQKGRLNGRILAFCQFRIDLSRHMVWKMDDSGKRRERLHLSPIEYKLLELFISNMGKLLTYGEIYQCVWKTDDLGDVRTVMVHVSNLRKKVDGKDSGMIQTVRGIGYVFYDR